ncbi:MAG: aspartate 1-decarboxylase [Candidatus Omnitrophica bacterium]|nr:aspartate 1-decarboxylase [Candidatus Omnitrophota bacterium]
MLITVLKSKIHRVKVTEVALFYSGSITVDKALLRAANIMEGEKVEVLNLNNGSRIETYAIPAAENSGKVCLNGPAARSGYVGDEIVILAYALVDENEAKTIKPQTVFVCENNRITSA